MVRPAKDEDITDQSEDYYAYVNKATLTANTPTTVIEWDIDAGEQLTLERIGTNGGSDISLAIMNKNDTIGEIMNGINAPMNPTRDHYVIAIPLTFETGDHFKLVATSAAGATYVKFFARGHKID